MGLFKVFQCIFCGILLAIGLTHGVRNFYDNVKVAAMAKVDTLSLMFFLPLEYNSWEMVDATTYLKPRKNRLGQYGCIHVIPVAPKYQTITTLTNGDRVCCDISPKTVLIPTAKHSGSYYFYCGNYPEQQVVSLPISYVNKL